MEGLEGTEGIFSKGVRKRPEPNVGGTCLPNLRHLVSLQPLFKSAQAPFCRGKS